MRSQIGYIIVESTDGINWSPIYSANTYDLCKQWLDDEKMFAEANLWRTVESSSTKLVVEAKGTLRRFYYAIWDIDRLY